jgi:hypothetical protein
LDDVFFEVDDATPSAVRGGHNAILQCHFPCQSGFSI